MSVAALAALLSGLGAVMAGGAAWAALLVGRRRRTRIEDLEARVQELIEDRDDDQQAEIIRLRNEEQRLREALDRERARRGTRTPRTPPV